MHVDGIARALGALLLVALVVAPAAVYPAVQAQTVEDDPALAAAEAYITKIEEFINKTLTLAEMYNITLPDNLTVLVNQSFDLLEQARAALEEGNATLAIQLANEASSTFADVAVYVWSNLNPDVKQELMAAQVEAAVQTRLMVAERLSLVLEQMNETCGCVTAQIAERVQMLVQMAEQARMALKMGNVSGAQQIVARFDVEARQTMQFALRQAQGTLEGVSAAVAAIRGAVQSIEAVADYLNQTISLIEQNQTDLAIARLENATLRLDNLTVMLENIYTAAEAQGANETYLEAIMTLYNATVDARDLVNASIYSLEQNDTETAIAYISMAVETLYNATLQVADLPLPGQVKAQVMNMAKVMGKLQAKMAVATDDMYERISAFVDNTLARLQDLLEKYQAGQVSEAKVKAEFAKAKQQLENILRIIQDDAPQDLVQKVQDAINWIDENTPSTSQPGGGQGGKGGMGRP